MTDRTRRGGLDPPPRAARIGPLPRRARCIAALTACLLALIAAPSAALTVIVPDQFATIQQAIDFGANEILLRPGVYAETPVIADIPPNLDDWFNYDDLILRGLVPVGSSPDSIPVVAGLVFEDFYREYVHSPSITLADLRFSKAVENRFGTSPFWNPLQIVFNRCSLDSGLTDAGATEGGQLEYSVVGCRIGGPLWLYYPQRVSIADCLVHAPITIAAFSDLGVSRSRFEGSRPFAIDFPMGGGDEIEISNCTFEGFRTPIRKQGQQGPLPIVLNNNTFIGPGVTPLLTAPNAEVYLNGNRISGFDIGLEMSGTLRGADLGAADNIIEDCDTALRADVDYVDFNRNVIRSCRKGVTLRARGGLRARRNVVQTCASDGMVLDVGFALIDSNAVGRCDGAGIRLTTANIWGYTSRMTANTSYGNAGTGFVVTASNPNFVTSVDHNISYGNGLFGLETSGIGSLEVSCNDWFGNGAGLVSGIASTSDLALDPLFCDVFRDDITLSAGSPLLNAAGCGPIGALGQGCEAPIVCRLATFTAASTTEGIEVRWQVADTAPGFFAWLERSKAADGSWAKVQCERSSDGDVTVESDRTVAPAQSYWYRLVATDRGLTRALGEPIRVETAPPTRFALLGTGPNPSPGAVEVTFQLAHAAEITVELFDAQGRRVTTLASGSWPAGIHRAPWAGARPASGVYLVRYRYPGGEDLRRIAIVR